MMELIQFEKRQSLAVTKLYDATLTGDLPSLLNVVQENPLILDRCMIENSSRFMASPLHVAASTVHLEIIKTLLAMKPIMCFTHDQYGRNPIHIAAINGHIEVLQELLQVNPQAAREQTNKGETYLHLCIKHGHVETLQQLLHLTNDAALLNAKDNNEDTILHYAVVSKQTEMIKAILKDERIDINAVNKEKLTALDCHMVFTKRPKRHKSCFGKVMINWNDDDEIGPYLEDAKALPAKEAQEVKHRDNWVESQSNGLMVVASLVATMAFTLGISPPGGFWQDPDKRPAGVGIIYTLSDYYDDKDFKDLADWLLIANAIALGSSLSVILLLISGLPSGRPLVVILRATMWIAVTATTVTYAISIYLVSNGLTNATSNITIFIWVGLVGLVILVHLFKFLVKFIIRRRKLRSPIVKCFHMVRGSTLSCLEC